MPKRFTDTEKWSDPWFRKLPVNYKMFWNYLCDRCDHAGIWKVDMELANFHIGAEISANEALAMFDGRVVPQANTQYWWVRGFISYQYGTLSNDCPPHKKIIALILDHKRKGMLKESARVTLGLPKGTSKKDPRVQEEEEEEEEVKEVKTLSAETNFEALWDLYPNKDGKRQALRSFKASVKTEEDWKNIQLALKNYINSKRVKDGFIKNGSTFFANWSDWVNFTEQPLDTPLQGLAI